MPSGLLLLTMMALTTVGVPSCGRGNRRPAGAAHPSRSRPRPRVCRTRATPGRPRRHAPESAERPVGDCHRNFSDATGRASLRDRRQQDQRHPQHASREGPGLQPGDQHVDDESDAPA